MRLIVIEKVRNYGKVVLIKSMFENGWCGGDASPTSPLNPLLRRRAFFALHLNLSGKLNIRGRAALRFEIFRNFFQMRLFV